MAMSEGCRLMVVELSVTENKHTHSLPDNCSILGLWEYKSIQLLPMFVKVCLLWTVNFSRVLQVTLLWLCTCLSDVIATCYYNIYVI